MELIQQCYHDLFWGALVLLGLGLRQDEREDESHDR